MSDQRGADESQRKIIFKLAELMMQSPTLRQLLDSLDAAEIETALRGYPEDVSESLTLFAMLTARLQDGNDDIRNDRLCVVIDDCAIRLSLEWLKRHEAIFSYEYPLGGDAEWEVNPARLTPDFVRELEARHKPLHKFATFALNRCLSPRN